MHRFEGTIHTADGGGAYIPIPPDIVAALGGGGRIPVRATFDNLPYTGSIVSMGGGPCLGILKAIRTTLGKGPGDTVTVALERDNAAARTLEIPTDLATALATAGVRDTFDALSYTHRREHINGINEAKRPETRARRIDKLVTAVWTGKLV